MKKNIRFTLIGVIIGIMISFSVSAITGSVQKTLDYNNIKILLNGEELTPTDAEGNIVEPFIIDGTTYLPVRAIATALGLNVEWDADTNTVILGTDAISDSVAGKVIYEENNVKITYSGVSEENEYYAYNLLIENNSDKEIRVQGFDVYANSFAMGDNATFGVEILPGKKAAKYIDIRKYMLNQSEITKVETIEFTLRIDGSENKVVFNP